MTTTDDVFPPCASCGHAMQACPSNSPSLPDQRPGNSTTALLTPLSTPLIRLETGLQEPRSDAAKIAALREAIAKGDYRVDSALLARKITESEKTLFS